MLVWAVVLPRFRRYQSAGDQRRQYASDLAGSDLAGPAPGVGGDRLGPERCGPGFFSVVSSNGGLAGSAIIWAVARPTATPPLTLYAFDARPVNGRLIPLYSSPAGQWMNMGANANVVPVVANGKVYVASYRRLMIFGPNGTPAPASASLRTSEPVPMPVGMTWRVSGALMSIDGPKLSLLTRAGQIVRVDDSAAAASQRTAILTVGSPYTVVGDSTAETHERKAIAITRAKASESSWPDES